MATIYDVKQSYTTVAQTAAAAHNAQIKERFQQLQNVERTQFAQLSQQSRASVLAPERPVETQVPVQEVQERTVSAFSVETLDRAIQNAPVLPSPVAPVETQAAKVEKVQLSRFAKGFMATCGAAIVTLLCSIGVLTQVINANQLEIAAVETRNAQLQQRYEQIMAEKEQLTSQETIDQWAQSQGMVKAN